MIEEWSKRRLFLLISIVRIFKKSIFIEYSLLHAHVEGKRF